MEAEDGEIANTATVAMSRCQLLRWGCLSGIECRVRRAIYVLQIMYPTVVGMKTDLSGVLTVCVLIIFISLLLLTLVFHNCHRHFQHNEHPSCICSRK